jgi:toxin ParE1/3/4
VSRVEVSALAQTDLLNIYLYGAEAYGRDAALRYAASLHESFSLIAKFPKMGRVLLGFEPTYRRHEHGVHIIFYEEKPDGVSVLRIVHRSQLKRVPF